MNHKVQDHGQRIFEHKDITLIACDVDSEDNIMAIDVVINGTHIYCLPITTEDPYQDTLARIFDVLTPKDKA